MSQKQGDLIDGYAPASSISTAKVCLLCRWRHSRHTFATDMVRAGISLPALMQLMGHADIETTMHYVQVSPQDVYVQYARAAAQCIHPQPRIER
jgi:site-specific recombinase XerD